jgi:Transposase domain (DUF772)
MGQLGFFDLNRRYESLSEKNDPLVAIAAMVPFESIRPKLHTALIKGELRRSEAERRNSAGRKPWDEVVIFKALVLQALYNLSDDQAEYQLRDRFSFMRFLGLELEDAVPDAKTLWLYREALAKAGAVEELFDLFDARHPQPYAHRPRHRRRSGRRPCQAGPFRPLRCNRPRRSSKGRRAAAHEGRGCRQRAREAEGNDADHAGKRALLPVCRRAEWTLRALSGGYAREPDKSEATPGPYRLIGESLESFASFAASLEDDAPPNPFRAAANARGPETLAVRAGSFGHQSQLRQALLEITGRLLKASRGAIAPATGRIDSRIPRRRHEKIALRGRRP